MGKGSWSAPARHRSNGRHRATQSSPAIGWAPRPEVGRGETVAAVIDRDHLNDALATLHAQGYGPNTRVLDGARGDLAAQLTRSGIPGSTGDLNLGERPLETAVVLVHAPGRGERVTALLRATGPRDLQVFGQSTIPAATPSVAAASTDSDPAAAV